MKTLDRLIEIAKTSRGAPAQIIQFPHQGEIELVATEGEFRSTYNQGWRRGFLDAIAVVSVTAYGAALLFLSLVVAH